MTGIVLEGNGLEAAQPPYSGHSRWSLRLGFDRRQRTPAGAPGVSKLPRFVERHRSSLTFGVLRQGLRRRF
ncbi:MAG: hypothetical protein ACRD2E_11820 [Terriglobales bacterium]